MNVNGHDVSKVNIKPPTKTQPISFDWDEYLKSENGIAAPNECFNQNIEPPLNEFELRQKLEITSPETIDFVNIATVVNYIGCRLQLRLDGCDNSNDIFELVDSVNIHPIGYHDLPGKYFAAPLRFRKDAASYPSFCLQTLKTAVPAPESAFKTPPKPPRANLFKPGMKLEAVDIKHPSNICPATVASVDRNQIFIELDGWDSTNGFKTSYLSRNLFPVGWCKKTGHFLQHPGPKVDLKNLKKESNVSATTTPNNVKSSNQQNNVNLKEGYEDDSKTTSVNVDKKPSPKAVPPNSNAGDKLENKSSIPINSTYNTNNKECLSTGNSINNIAITTAATPPTATITSKLSNTNATPKSNSDIPLPIKNISSSIKNEKNLEHPIKGSNNIPSNNVLDDRGFKRQYEQIDNSVKLNSNVASINYKSIVPKVGTPQIKPPLQMKQVPQVNSIFQSRILSQPRQPSVPQQNVYPKQANFTLQPRPSQINVSLHQRPPQPNVKVHSSPQSSSVTKLNAQMKSTPQPVPTPQPQSKFISAAKPTIAIPATVVPVVNGNKSSSVFQYKNEFPSSKVVNRWSVEEVIQFLNMRISEFSKCEEQFRSHEIDGKAFLLLTNEPMMKFMQIKLGLSLKICNLVDRINGSS